MHALAFGWADITKLTFNVTSSSTCSISHRVYYDQDTFVNRTSLKFIGTSSSSVVHKLLPKQNIHHLLHTLFSHKTANRRKQRYTASSIAAHSTVLGPRVDVIGKTTLGSVSFVIGWFVIEAWHAYGVRLDMDSRWRIASYL